jgi:cytochrome bd-type quinol oxidase subunit 2
VVLAAGPMGALDDQRRRRIAVLLAAPLALAIFTPPGAIVTRGTLGPAELAEYFGWMPPALFHNGTMTVPAAVGAALGTWIALRAMRRLREPARRRTMAAVLVLLGGAAVTQAWHRPDLPAEYAQSAFADLGTATFLAALAVLVALASFVRLRPSRC